MSLHNSCAGNKPVITGGWGSGQAGRGGEGGQTCLPAPVLGFHPPSPPSPLSPPPLPLFIMQTRIASLLEVGLHFKGAPCLRSLPALPPKTPNTPNQEHPLLGRRGETELQRLWGSPVGKPFATSAQPNYPPPSWGSSPLCGRPPCLSLPTYHPWGAGTPGTGRETPARPPGSRLGHAAPRPSLAGEPDEPDPLPRAPGGLIGSFARAEPPGAGAGARRD